MKVYLLVQRHSATGLIQGYEVFSSESGAKGHWEDIVTNEPEWELDPNNSDPDDGGRVWRASTPQEEFCLEVHEQEVIE